MTSPAETVSIGMQIVLLHLALGEGEADLGGGASRAEPGGVWEARNERLSPPKNNLDTERAQRLNGVS